MNDEYMKYLEKRLSQWAEWFSHGNWYGIGYPSCTIEYRLMNEGIIARNQYQPKSIPCNKEAEEMELLVKEMAEHNQIMAHAIRCHYFTSGGLRAKAKQIDMSHMQFKYYVDMAHQWLAGRLSKKKTKSKSACTVNTSLV